METKTIKGIRNEKWMQFKALAARKKMNMGRLFEVMIDNYEQNADKLWDSILHGEKILSDNQAKQLEKMTVAMRKEKGFRNDARL